VLTSFEGPVFSSEVHAARMKLINRITKREGRLVKNNLGVKLADSNIIVPKIKSGFIIHIFQEMYNAKPLSLRYVTQNRAMAK